MLPKECFKDGSAFKNTLNPREDSIKNREVIFSILKKYEGNIPQDVWKSSLTIISNAFEDFHAPQEGLKDIASSVFLVHTRRYKRENTDVGGEAFTQLDDSTRCIPFLDPKYGMVEGDVERLWNSMPPFKVGEVRGMLNGKPINCAIISVPITPKALDECGRASKRRDYARPRIVDAAELAKKMGARIIGLGETLAALTNHGRSLEQNIQDVKFTTGHAFTVAFMNKITEQAAKTLEIDLKRSQVTIIGANGSIGSAMIEMLLEQGVGGLNLHDTAIMKSALRSTREKILSRCSRVKVTGGNEELREACRGSRIMLIASSAPEPFIKGEYLDPGTIVINDAQPPGMTLEEAKKKGETIWVAGTLPEALSDSFNCGLIGRAEWTCLLETLARDAGENSFEGTGPVDHQRAAKAWETATKLGMRIAPYQSWGVLAKMSPGIFK